MTLEEKQYSLDGVVFGADCPVEVASDGWMPGSAALRTQDVDNPDDDGVRMGKDYKGSATWAFSLYTNQETESAAWAAFRDLATAWDADEVRSTAGAVSELRYCIDGAERVIYGRPRRWTPKLGPTLMSGRLDIEADFATVDHRFYGPTLNSKSITLGSPLDPDAGLIVPFIPPFSSSAASSVRESAVTIGGEVPTPIIVKITGPVEDVAVRIGDWTAALVDPVTAENPVTFDPRPWVRAVTQANGGGVRVSPRITRVSKMWLPPGTHQVIFTGTDRTSTANVLVSWREAYRTIR